MAAYMVMGAYKVLYSMYQSYFSCIKRFGRTPSASCPVYRNVNDEERLPSMSV